MLKPPRLSRRRRRRRDGFSVLAIVVVIVIGMILAATVVVVNAATSAEQTRVEQAQAFFAGVTTTGSGIPRFIVDLGDPPGRLSDLSSPITTAGANLCTKPYTNGDVAKWTGSYAARVFSPTGVPAGIGVVSDTLLYEEVAFAPRLVFLVREVPEQEAARLDARVDTLVGTAGSAAGVVRWSTADATGLVTLRWSVPMNKKCSGANQNPTAAFTFVCTALSCTFTDGSTDSDGSVTSWSWTFGDATSSAAQNPTKVYASAGTYNVTLTVTDNGLGQGSISQDVSVSNIVLTGTGRKVGGNRFADLTWTGATTVNVDIYRDNVLLVTTLNDGAHTDAIANNIYVYRVCEAGTQICSNSVSVDPP